MKRLYTATGKSVYPEDAMVTKSVALVQEAVNTLLANGYDPRDVQSYLSDDISMSVTMHVLAIAAK